MANPETIGQNPEPNTQMQQQTPIHHRHTRRRARQHAPWHITARWDAPLCTRAQRRTMAQQGAPRRTRTRQTSKLIKTKHITSNTGTFSRTHPCRWGARLRAWSQSCARVATYNCCTWHLMASMPSDIRTWELQRLRRMLKMKMRPGEDRWQCNRPTANMICKRCADTAIRTMPERVWEAVFKGTWKVAHFKLDSGDAPLHVIRRFRDAA